MDIHDLSLFRRMLCSLSPHIGTWWGNPLMFPSTSVGWSGLSCFSLAICRVLPRGARLPRRANYTYCPDDIPVKLVIYSTFEPMILPGGGPMEAMGVQKLYEPSPTPILYVGLAADAGARRVPLMPLFLLGSSTPTIPHQLLQHRGVRFPHGLAGAADE